jgi:hypothetical protein
MTIGIVSAVRPMEQIPRDGPDGIWRFSDFTNLNQANETATRFAAAIGFVVKSESRGKRQSACFHCDKGWKNLRSLRTELLQRVAL